MVERNQRIVHILLSICSELEIVSDGKVIAQRRGISELHGPMRRVVG